MAGESGNGNGGGEGAGEPLDAESFRSQHRALIAYLRARFRGALTEEDFEDLAQEAWTAVLRRRAAGKPIDDVVALMRSIAWRDARDRIRDRRDAAVDPSDQLFERTEDACASPLDQLSSRAELARAIEAVEQLPTDQRAAYRARFVDGLSTRSACKRLGLPRSTYHHRLRRAVETVEETLDPERFSELQSKLVSAYVAGVASGSERRRAERLVRTDPEAAATARELRRAHEAAAVGAAPVALEPERPAGIFERLAALPGKARDVIAGAGERGAEAADLASPALASGGTRGAGTAATGVLAKLAGIGGAGKAALACVGTTAAATACVAAGVVPAGGALDLAGAERDGAQDADGVEEVVAVEDPPRYPPSEPVQDEQPSPPPTPAEGEDAGAEEPAADETPSVGESTAPLSPATPPSAQQFDPVVEAASQVPTQSGSSGPSTTAGGGGGGGDASRQEFGGP